MKRLRPLLPLLALLVLSACRNDDIERPNRPDVRRRLTLEQARAAYDNALLRTTRAEMEPGMLYAGEIELFWDEAQFSENDCVSSFDVRIRAERYYETVEEEEIAEICLFPKVVVVNDKLDAERTSAYVAFYFPDHAERLDDEHVGDDYLNSLPKLNYSGRIVYTNLQGYPVAAARYLDGRQTDRVFFYDARDSLSLVQLIDRYNRMVENIRIRPFDAGTRAAVDGKSCNYPGVSWELFIDDVVVYGQKLEPFNPVKNPGFGGYDQLVRPEVDPTQGSSGGSSGGGASNQGAYVNNPKIKADNPDVQRMLDTIYMDCMGKTLIDNLNHDIEIITAGMTQNRNRHEQTGSYHKSTIIFGEGNAENPRNHVLLEELIHAYQFQNTSALSNLNFEIEAKVGWVLYEMRRLDTSIFINGEYDSQLGRPGGTETFQTLIEYCYPNMNNNDIVQTYLYEEAIYSLRTIRGYQDTKRYPELKDLRNFNNLIELMKNCPEL